MLGTARKVLRSLLVTALVLAAAGCGRAGPQPHADRGLPRTLASTWATRASAIASAAAAGDTCRASQLASSLREEIIAEEGKVPARLQGPLVQAANALADRISCVTPPQTVTVIPTPSRQPKHKRDDHHDRKHGHGDGGDQR